MKITEIQLREIEGGFHELSAEVSVQNPRPQQYRIWFQGPTGCFGQAPLGDIYFAAFWIPSMFLHEEFEIDGEISKELLDAAYEKLEPFFLKAHAGKLVAARVRGHRLVETSARPSAGLGCLYSGGVDSNYTAIKNLDRVTSLVFISGFEILWKREDLLEKAVETVKGGAAILGRELVILRSNLQDPIHDLTMRSAEIGRATPGFPIEFYFGSMLVAFNLCLRGILGKSLIPSSWTESSTTLMGSDSQIEPNWSTSTMSFELDGTEADRIDKLRHVVDNCPQVFRALRVCTQPSAEGVINCGVCAKCIRTMMEMRIAGAGPEAYQSFSAPLDLRLAKRTLFSRDGGLMKDLARRAREAGDREIIRTTDIILGNRFYLPRFQVQVAHWWRSRLTVRDYQARIRRRQKHQRRRALRRSAE